MKISTGNLIYIFIIMMSYIMINTIIYYDSSLVILITLIQLILIALAISPPAEAILRLIYGVSKIRTQRSKEYLYPLFNEVYEAVKREEGYKNNKIQLYFDESMDINAYAIGSRTIAVTKGAVQYLSEDQLKGVLAHEFGHIVHGDTLIPAILIIGNINIAFIILLIKIIQGIMNLSDAFIGKKDNIANRIIGGILHFGLFLIVQLINLFLLINQRSNEYNADEFALRVGYGDELIRALYRLTDFDLGGKKKLLDRIKNSHPDIQNRIEKLEGKLAKEGGATLYD